MPVEPKAASRYAVALMELGALVCTARAPRCAECVLAEQCAWRLAGSPPYDGPRARRQDWAGTDRQARGALLGRLRESTGATSRSELAAAWPLAVQRRRALAGLVADGLVEATAGGFQLPT